MVYVASPQGKILRLEGYAVAIRQLKIMVKGELNCIIILLITIIHQLTFLIMSINFFESWLRYSTLAVSDAILARSPIKKIIACNNTFSEQLPM